MPQLHQHVTDTLPSAEGFSTPKRPSHPSSGLGGFILSPFSPMDVDSHDHARKPLISVFDWDDTLCPSGWLYRKGLLASHGLMDDAIHTPVGIQPRRRHYQQHYQNQPIHAALATHFHGTASDKLRLEHLEDQVLVLLRLARQFGPVFIISAAKMKWVMACATLFLPRVALLFAHHSNDFQVVSAREWYHHHVRQEGNALAWKTATFDAMCAHLRVEEVYHRLKQCVDLLSVGDSLYERDACREMEAKAPTIVNAKTLKFVEKPTLEELQDQVTMAQSIYERMCHHVGSLDLQVVRKSSTPDASIAGMSGQRAPPSLQLVQSDLPTNTHRRVPSVPCTSTVSGIHSTRISPPLEARNLPPSIPGIRI